MDNEKLKPWDYVNSILHKKYINNYSTYTSFIINRYFSSNIQYILFTKYINKNYPYLTNKMHYDYYYYIIDKTYKKLFYPKFSEKKDKQIKMIQEYFEINYDEALMYYKNISKDDMKKIKKELQKRNKIIK